jgi:hypothetical protein
VENQNTPPNTVVEAQPHHHLTARRNRSLYKKV